MVSLEELATSPVTLEWLVNGATLPARCCVAGRGAALADPVAPRMDMPSKPAAAPTAPATVRDLDMVPLSQVRSELGGADCPDWFISTYAVTKLIGFRVFVTWSYCYQSYYFVSYR